MSTKVIERPSAISFSKNELRYKFFTDNLALSNLFIQVQLLVKKSITNSYFSWVLDEHQSPFIDNHLIIKVNGSAVVNAATSASGTLDVKDGDTIEISQGKESDWPDGTYYAKLIVWEDATIIVNEIVTFAGSTGGVTSSFWVHANKTYKVHCYTRATTDVPSTTNLDMPAVGSFTKLKTFNLKPNTDGNTYLYIDGWIDSLLKYIVPDLTAAFTNASEQTIEYYILYRQISALDLDPAWTSTEADHIRVAIKGGIEKQKSSRNNYFLYQAANKLFFSWIPSGRFVFSNQHNFLSVFIATAATYKLHIIITKIDGSSVTHNINLLLTAGRFYHINISYATLDLNSLASGDAIHFYDISLLDGSDAVIYTAARFYLEYRPQYENFELLYHNSLGGIDTVKVKGDTTLSIDKDVIELDGGMSISGWSDLVKTGESLQQSTKRDTYKGNIGFIHSKAHQEALQDLLISQSIYQYMDGRLVPVLNLQKSIDIRKTSDRIYAMPIEWVLPFSNEVFTPKDIALGLGTDTETY